MWWAVLTSISSYGPSVKSSQVALGSDLDAVNYSFFVVVLFLLVLDCNFRLCKKGPKYLD